MDGSTCPCLGLLSTSRGRLLVVVWAGDGGPGRLNRQPSLRADLASRTAILSTFRVRNFMRLCVTFPQQPLSLHPLLIFYQKPPSPPHQLGLRPVSSNTRRALSLD